VYARDGLEQTPSPGWRGSCDVVDLPIDRMMVRGKLMIATLVAVLASMLAPALASANARDNPNGFRLTTPQLTVPQNAGQATFTIVRKNTRPAAQIRYTTLRGTAVAHQDYTPVKAMIAFAPGQASATFSIPIVNHGTYEVPKTVRLELFGPFRQGLANPHSAVLRIVAGTLSPVAAIPGNPLALTVTPPPTDPLTGASAFVDLRKGLAAVAARHLKHRHPGEAGMLDVIAREPGTGRWGNWTKVSQVGVQVSSYLARAAAESPGSVPELSTYWIVNAHKTHPDCGHYSDTAARERTYDRWVTNFARGIGDYRAIVFLEVDSLITVNCLSHHGVQVRLQELHDAFDALSQDPRVVVYTDAGAADALNAARAARLLRRAGISEIQGFFLNATHFDWTRKEIRYGEKVSRMTGGKHFVVNTAMNGRGPVIPKDRVHSGNEDLCNPPARGLGPLPTFDTGFPRVDAFAWIAYPGRSGGCGPDAPPTGQFWVGRALSLVHHADYKVR
jgi:endoglucanase